MPRSGYSDDLDTGTLNLYRATVKRSIKGQRGQAFLRELRDAMDAMPEKILIADDLINSDGDCCAIGVVCKSRGLDISTTDPDCADSVGKLVGVARCLAAEIEYENDECGPWRGDETPAQRWTRMRKWVDDQIED